MRKALIIASRDYHAAVRTKAFVASLIVMPLMMSGSILVQALLQNVKDLSDQHLVVIDRTGGELFKELDAAAKAHNKTVTDPATGKQVAQRYLVFRDDEYSRPRVNPAQHRLNLSDRVRRGEFNAFLDIDARVFDPAHHATGVTFFSQRLTDTVLRDWAVRVIDDAVRARRYQDANIPAERVKVLSRPVLVDSRGLSRIESGTGRIIEGKTEDRLAGLLVPLALVMLMFMVVMIGASPLLQSVVEEKSLRIAEVLLGSVRPFELMLGKLLGTVGVSLTLSAVYLGGAYWAAVRFGWTSKVPLSLLGVFVVYQILAVLMYGSVFIAIGAACTDLRETQTLLMPVVFIMVTPIFFVSHVAEQPNGAVATGLSLVPFATPILMVMRQGVPPGIPIWQSILGMLFVIASTLACVWAAGRIFRVGLLMQGKGARLTDMLRWIVRG